tara:strand:- start:32030 stop:32494 length:465 start_codon:yes stop_codon:yes gene_type:complete
MREKEGFSYQKTDAQLESREEDSKFELLQLAHEGNIEGIRKMGAGDVLASLLSLLRRDFAGFELLSGSRKGETMLVTHLRDYILEVQRDKKKGWHQPLLAFLNECGFSHTEVRAVLNTNFYWSDEARENMDIAARAIGAPPIFAGYSPYGAGGD